MKMKPVYAFLLIFTAAVLLDPRLVTPGYGGSNGPTYYYYEDPAITRSRIIAEANEHTMNTIRESYEYRQKTMDRINRKWDDYIRGTDSECCRKCR